MLGCKQTNALIAFIFDKQLKLSSANNKFEQGQLVNFVQVDAMKLQMLAAWAPNVMRLPFVILFCFALLFSYLGWSFFSGIGVFIIAFFVNLWLGKVSARIHKKFMKESDSRVKSITESISNIKMLKLYSWT